MSAFITRLRKSQQVAETGQIMPKGRMTARIPGIVGPQGDDYVLTEEDKQEIADLTIEKIEEHTFENLKTKEITIGKYQVTEDMLYSLIMGTDLDATNGLAYNLSDDGEYYIVSKGTATTNAEIVISRYYDRLPVAKTKNYAFVGLTSIQSVKIPSTITTLGAHTFDNCSGLTSVDIASSVKSIENYAFYNCTGLESIVIPDSVTDLGIYVFTNCKNLKSVTLGNSITSLEERAFSACHSLEDINIPESVTSIGDAAFASCKALKTITIPESVTSIGAGGFYSCISLEAVTMESKTPPTLGANGFGACSALKYIYVPQGCADAYKSAPNWSEYADIIVEENV